MRLLGLAIRDFLPFGSLDLDLTDVSQLAMVGANGAGKSSLQDAVLWALYGQARGSADECIRHGESKASVATLWADTRGNVLIARERRRDKQTTLRFQVAGTDRTCHTIADTQAAIERFIGLDADALRATAFMVQESSDALMAANPAERKELLAALFGLGRYEVLAERAKRDMAMAQARLAVTEAETTRLRAGLPERAVLEARLVAAQVTLAETLRIWEALDGAVSDLAAQEAVVAERLRRGTDAAQTRDALAATCVELTVELDKLKLELTKQQRIAKAVLPAAPPDREQMAAAVALGEEHARLHEEIRLEIADLRPHVEVSRRQVALIDEVPCHGEGIYASCPLLAGAVEARGALPDRQRRLDALNERLAALEGTRATLGVLRQGLEALRLEEQAYQAAVTSRTVAIQALAHLRRRRADLDHRIADVSGRLAIAESEVKEAAGAFAEATRISEARARAEHGRREARTAVDFAQGDESLVQRQLEQATQVEAELAALAEFRARTERELDIATTLARAFGRDGIPLLVLENGIPQIEDRVNDILSRMPGAWALTLVTQRETKAGTIRDTLDIEVSQDAVTRPYKMFSGGERLRIDFALRVALASVLTARTGTAFETLWLDEGWGSQDAQGTTALLEAIAAVADDFGLIVCVSHIESVTDRFPARLRVIEHDGVTSAVLEAA